MTILYVYLYTGFKYAINCVQPANMPVALGQCALADMHIILWWAQSSIAHSNGHHIAPN